MAQKVFICHSEMDKTLAANISSFAVANNGTIVALAGNQLLQFAPNAATRSSTPRQSSMRKRS